MSVYHANVTRYWLLCSLVMKTISLYTTSDVYEGELTLQECFNFTAPDHGMSMTIRNSGDDAWQPELFRVLFDDFLYVQCNDGELIGNGESHVLMCEMLNGNETLV